MIKQLLYPAFALYLAACKKGGAMTPEDYAAKTGKPVSDRTDLYALTTRTLEGKDMSLSELHGKVTLVVNVASKCGFTHQYGGLEKLYEQYKDRGFTILGFPSDDFGHQEPGTEAEIRSFCSTTYGVTFPMMKKGHVKGGEAQPFYAAISSELPEPAWNFTKYLVGKDGRLVATFPSTTKPEGPELKTAIETALAAK